MTNNPKDIDEVIKELDKITFKQLEEAIKKADKEFKENSYKAGEQVSKADKMFEELGYEKDETGDEIIYQLNNHEICFLLNRKMFDCGCGIGREVINMQELQAINEKCKELGWLDE